MGRRVVVQIRFAHEEGDNRPVAASTKRRGTGARVTLEVEEEAIDAGELFVLYRRRAGVVVAGSAHRARVETAQRSLGSAYAVVRIPIDDGDVQSAVG